MANNSKRNNLAKIKFVMIIAVVALFFCSVLFQDKFIKILNIASVEYRKNEVTKEVLMDSNYRVHYIDVGQGNSSFIEFPDGKTMLIDAGNTMYGQTVVDYISSFNISTIDYLVATHSDSDHVGGMDKVFESFEVKNIYRPFQISGTGTSAATFVPYEYEDLADVYSYYKSVSTNNKISRVNSSVYQTFIRCAYTETYHEENEVKSSSVTVFFDGLEIGGDGYEIEFFAPLKRTEELDLTTMSNTLGYATVGYGVSNNNDNSPVMLISIGSAKYFYSGDASWKTDSNDTSTKHAEQDFVNSLTDEEKLKFSDVTVYLAGHHGSKYSSSEELTELISAKFVVISVGQNNYGHPSQDAIARFEKNFNEREEDYLLRTDLNGNIVFGTTQAGVRYCLQKTDEIDKLTISPVVASALICAGLVIIIISIKPSKNYSRKRNYR